MEKFGRKFEKTSDGGWLEVGAELPKGSTAVIAGEAIVFEDAARNMFGGVFEGGSFYGGSFHGGEFRGGAFHDGVFDGGSFYGGVFRGGLFHGGTFRRGTILGGVFNGGTFYSSPCCAMRSDGYMFVAKYVGGDLRIWAGCRNFSWDEAVSHWSGDHERGEESRRIINFLKAQAKAERARDAEMEKAK